METAELVDTTTDLRELISLAFMCYWCKKRPANWLLIWDVCRHHHQICDVCKVQREQEEAIAHSATPPRKIANHKCCGASIYHIYFVPLG